MVFPILGSGDSSAGYNIENSLRFNRPDSPALYRTNDSGGSNTTATISFWMKKGPRQGSEKMFYARSDNSNNAVITLSGSPENRLELRSYNGGNLDMQMKCAVNVRDHSAWYHIVMMWVTADGTAADRARMYINGERVTNFHTYSDLFGSSDTIEWFQSDATFYISGEWENGTIADAWDGYIAEVYVIDGTAYDPNTFGETDEDSGIWKPKEAFNAGTNSPPVYGTNGFRLEFKQTGTSANSSGMGADTSGNDNHLTVSNLTALDQTTDTPTNNFATLNPLQASLPTNAIYQGLFEGNLGSWTSSNDNTVDYRQWSTIAIPHNEKWYVETKWTRDERDHTKGRIGILAYHDDVTHGVVLEGDFDKTVNNSSSSYASGSMAYGEIFGALYDLENNQVTFYEAGSSLGTISWTPNASYTYYHVVFSDPAGPQSLEFLCNFGNPAHSIASGNADPNGYGNFEYGTNSGYALCTKNLAEFGG